MRPFTYLPGAIVAALLAGLGLPAAAQQPGTKQLDPFMLVVDGVPSCPRQTPTLLTPEQIRAEAHYRAERGTSCYQAGRCRLPNAYLYDAEIIPRVKQALLFDGRFKDASIWAEGRRRWVWLKGCVKSAAQAAAAEQLVRGIDDVESVVNELVVLPAGK